MKDQPKHTPGPWTIHKQNAYHISYVVRGGKKENQIAQCFNWQDKGFDVNSEANAKLIAAAPDLLESLKALTTNPHVNLGDLVYKVRDSEGEGWDGPQVKAWSDAVQAAAAAIAKAEGREG